MKVLVTLSFIHMAIAQWTYPDQGTWKMEAQQCGLNRQSPINIISYQAIENPAIGNLKLVNYKTRPGQAWKVANTGSTMKVSANGGFQGGRPEMHNIYGNNYKFEQFHFHWGWEENPGSEHLVDYKQYPAELHLVHSRSDVNLAAAGTWENLGDSLAVLGVFIEVGPEENPGFQYLIEAAENIQEKSEYRNAARFTLD